MKRLMISLLLLPLLTSCEVAEERYYEPEYNAPVIVHSSPQESRVYRQVPNGRGVIRHSVPNERAVIRHSAPREEVEIVPPPPPMPRNTIRHSEAPANVIRHSQMPPNRISHSDASSMTHSSLRTRAVIGHSDASTEASH
jgi:hypothetical protein